MDHLEVASKRGVLDIRLLRIPRGGVQTPLLDHGTLRFADPNRGGGVLQHDADITHARTQRTHTDGPPFNITRTYRLSDILLNEPT